jgi:hypothetical protein
VIRCELDLAHAASEERLESQVRTVLMFDTGLYRRWEAATSGSEKLAVMEAELSGL